MWLGHSRVKWIKSANTHYLRLSENTTTEISMLFSNNFCKWLGLYTGQTEPPSFAEKKNLHLLKEARVVPRWLGRYTTQMEPS